MKIEIKRQSKEMDRDFARTLKRYNEDHPGPDIGVFWNSTSLCLDRKRGLWGGRWEIWVEVTDNSHPGNKYLDKTGDTWHNGKRWRFLNTYKNDDGSFAPLDDRVFTALHWADTWRNKNHYDETVMSLDRSKREQELAATRETASQLASYWRDYGDDVSKFGPGTTGNWRRSGL